MIKKSGNRNRNRSKRKCTAGFVACSMAMSLVVSGCANSANGNVSDSKSTGTKDKVTGDATESKQAVGRYMEAEIELPEGTMISCMQQTADGKILVVDETNAVLLTSSDQGATWESKNIDAIAQLGNDENIEFTAVSVAPDGGIFFSYNNWAEATEEGSSSYPSHYIYVDAAGNASEIPLEIPDFTDSLMEAEYSSDGRLFAMSMVGEIYELDLNAAAGKKLFTTDNQGMVMKVCGEKLLVLDYKQAYQYDLKTNSLLDSDEVLNQYLEQELKQNSNVVLCSGADDTLYLAGRTGIYAHVPDGSVMEQLAEGGLTNLGDQTRTPFAICQNQDGSFLIAYTDGRMNSYIYDANASAVPETQLSVYALEDNDTIRQTISEFRKNYPDVYVKFEIGVTGEDGVTKSDAINNLNTQLLAGEGPDVILLDGMPLSSYQEKGILQDLSRMEEKLTAENAYFEKILDCYDTGDGIWALPMRYEIPLLSGESSILEQITDLDTLASWASEASASGQVAETVIGTYTPEELLNKLYMVSSNTWLAADGSVDEKGLKSFMEAALILYQAEQKNLDEKEIGTHTEMIDQITDSGLEAADIFLNLNYQLTGALSGTQCISAGYLSDMSSFQEMTSIQQYDNNCTYRLFQGQDAKVFVPKGILGITSATGEKEMAEAFVETAFGENVQQKDLSDGFPVNADAYESYVKNPNPDSFIGVGITTLEGEEIDLTYTWPTEEEAAQLKDMIEQLDTPMNQDDTLKNIILEQGAQALTGEKDVEECVNEMVQKITLYQQE